MKCPTLEQLAQYQMEGLTPARMARMQMHVGACAHCRQQLAGLTRTDQLVASVPSPVMPEDLWPAVAARLQARQSWLRWWWKSAAAAGVAASLLLGLAVMHQREQAPLPTASPMVASYVTDHQFLAAQDPLTDRASVGLALAAYGGER